MKQFKKKLISCLPYIITILIVFLTVFLIIELNTNKDDTKLSDRDIKYFVYDDKVKTNEKNGLLEAKKDDEYLYLGYINNIENNNGFITMNENSDLFIASKISFLWKMKIYVNNNVDANNIIFKLESSSGTQKVIPIIEKDEKGTYLFFDVISHYSPDLYYHFDFTKEVTLERIEIYIEKTLEEISYCQLELNEDNNSYKIVKLNSHAIINSKNEEELYTIIPDIYKGLPVTDYETSNFTPAGYVKVGSNIQTIYEESFGLAVKYIEFSENGHTQKIEKYAFNNTNLDVLYIPSYIKTIHSLFIMNKSSNIIKVVYSDQKEFSKFDNSCINYYNIKPDQLLHIDKMTYLINDDYATLIDVDNDLNDVNIPNIINDKYPVKVIEDYIIYRIDNIKSITLPDSVIDIKSIFYNNIVTVDQLSKVNEYNNGLYLGSTTNKYLYLLNVNNAAKVILHSDMKFMHEDITNEITLSKQLIENGCVYVGTEANPYYWCIEIGSDLNSTSYTINENTKIIKDFSTRRLLTVTLPKGLEKIMNWEGQGNLKLIIDDSNPYFKTYCGSLYKVQENGLALIYASKSSISNREFMFIDNCVEIKDHAINGLLIDKLILPDTLEIIEDEAFISISFQQIYIPGSLKYMGNLSNLLSRISNINLIELDINSTILKLEDEMLLSYDKTILYKEFIDKNTFVVPEFVKYIKNNAINARNTFIHKNVLSIENKFTNQEIVFFEGSKDDWKKYEINVSKIYYDNQYTKYRGVIYAIIEDLVWAVSYDDSSSIVTLSSQIPFGESTYNLYGIGSFAFENAVMSSTIIIPDGVVIISGNAFYGIFSINPSKEMKVFIPDSVSKITGYMIYLRQTETVVKIYCQAKEKPSDWVDLCFTYADEVYYEMDSIPN